MTRLCIVTPDGHKPVPSWGGLLPLNLGFGSATALWGPIWIVYISVVIDIILIIALRRVK